MGLRDRIGTFLRTTVVPAPLPYVDNYWPYVNFDGHTYPFANMTQTIKGHAEEMDGSFTGLVQQAYKANGVVFACMLARASLFSEARFQFQALRGGRPGNLFSNPSLDILEHPYPTAVTGDLLARALQDADLAGTWYATRRRNAIRRMRPDWVTIVLGSEDDPNVEAGDIDADVLGIIYHPGGRYSGRDPVPLLRSQIAMFAPIPDPLASFRGMSWLTPIMREIAADKALTEQKNLYLVNGATPNIVVSLDKEMKQAESPQAFSEWVAAFKKLNPTGGWDKFKTMYLAGGTKFEVVGSDLSKMDYRAVQGAGEVRIAIAAGVPASIVGLSEGLQGAALNAGNYESAKRRFADITMRPLWRNMAGSLETIVPPPSGSRLWYDDRDIQALADDKKDLAEVNQFKAQTIRTYIDSGFTAESAIAAVNAGDETLLKHTGLFSVQLQAPGSTKMPAGEAPGETPVGPGTKPETLPAGEPSTKPVTQASVEQIVAVELTRVYQMLGQRTPVVFEQGAFQFNMPEVHVPVTIEDGAVQVTTPDIRIDSPITVEPAQLTIAEGAIRSETTIEPTQVTIEEGAVRIDSPITVERTEVTVEPAQVTVEPAEVTVNVPEQKPRTRRVVRDKKGAITGIEDI